jgi:hypothetical protein
MLALCRDRQRRGRRTVDYLTVAVARGAVLTRARRRVPRVLCPHEEAKRVLQEDTIANTQEGGTVLVISFVDAAGNRWFWHDATYDSPEGGWTNERRYAAEFANEADANEQLEYIRQKRFTFTDLEVSY